MSFRIGIDLGGTKIEALALDRAGREVFRKRVPTPRGDYAGTIAAVKALVSQIGESAVVIREGSAAIAETGRLARVW